MLKRISSGNIIKEDFEILSSRFEKKLTYEERRLFDKAINLYPTRAKVFKENMDYLESLKINNQPVPICIIHAKHNCKDAEMGSVEQAQSLERTLHLGKSVRVMLRYNAWTENGLVNGAMGTVVAVVHKEGEGPPEDMPAVILVEFD